MDQLFVCNYPKLFIIIIFAPLVANAEGTREIELYSKCHGILSDHPVEIDSADYKAVALGDLDPIDACENMFERARFVDRSNRREVANRNDEVAQAIVRKFNQFHSSWFSNMGATPDQRTYPYNVYVDSTEPALYITDALFSDRHFRSTFTRNDSIRGVREGAPPPFYTYDTIEFPDASVIIGPTVAGNQPYYQPPTPEPTLLMPDPEKPNPILNFHSIDGPKVPQGYLLGVQPQPDIIFPERLPHIDTNFVESDWFTTRETTATHNMKQHFGGGILGSPAFMISNAENLSPSDGGVFVHRRMSNIVFSDLLCLTLPTLRSEDVDAYMNKYKNSNLSFRQDRSCVRCHATLDPFAATARNIVFMISGTNQFARDVGTLLGTVHLFYYPKRMTVTTSDQVVSDSDRLYFRRSPEGQLYFRDYQGELVNHQVTGLQEMGEALANLDDPYVCAAQRYYQFLTGVQIPVENRDGT